MPRAIWNGAISFGLINIPVKLYAATSRKSVRFNQLDSRTGSRVRQRRVAEADGSEVPAEAIVKGYELPSGHYVVVTDEELAALDPKASRTIDLIEFVDQGAIDPIFYDAAYFVGPDQATVKPYALLVRTMAEAGKVGIARMVMRDKQYLCALRADGDKLVLSTMLYADEIRADDEIPGIDAVGEVVLDDRERSMAAQLLESLEAEFDPAAFQDTYREKVLALIEAKAAGETGLVETPRSRDDDKVIDLMAALEASVAEAKKARARHPTGRSAGEAGEAETPAGAGEAAGAKAAPTRRPGARKAAGAGKAAGAKGKAPAKRAASTSAKAAPARTTRTRKSA